MLYYQKEKNEEVNSMEKIASFCVNHHKLVPGIYVSRRDYKAEVVVTTFDLRVTRPNLEPAMDTAAIHTVEHLVATYLRNSSQKEEVIYFGPMGCKTGFYLVMFGELEPRDILELIEDAFAFVAQYQGEIPGATPRDCGNYSLQNLDMAHYYAKKYLQDLENHFSFEYEE